MRTCVRAILVHEDNILLIHRNKFGKEYYTLPGGGVDEGEELETAILREIDEETTINAKIVRKVAVEHPPHTYGPQHIFLCEYISGEPVLRHDSEEAASNAAGGNTYTPLWFPVGKLDTVTFLSPMLKTFIQNGLQNGFGDDVVVL